MKAKVKFAVQRLVRTTGFEVMRLPAEGPTGKLMRPIAMVAPMLDWFRYFSRMYDRVKEGPGDIVECGVGRGQSFFMLAYLMTRVPSPHARMLWGFDSFQGFPEPTLEDASPRNPKKGEIRIEQEEVLLRLEESGIDAQTFRDSIRIVPGFFDETLSQFPDRPIALLHIDADLYQSYRAVLTKLFPRVVPGGVVLFDEYGTVNFPGATKAINEYFAQTSCQIQREPVYGRYFVVKK